MCPKKIFVIHVIIQEVPMRWYLAPIILNAVGLIALVEDLKNGALIYLIKITKIFLLLTGSKIVLKIL
ncbi:MAG: hypothetical protein ACP5OH_08435 [Nitrososphaerota archaeon]